MYWKGDVHETYGPIGEQATASQEVYDRLARYPLLDALIERRSRRFGKGMTLNGGPLAYQSTHAPQPLSIEEEAAPGLRGLWYHRLRPG